MIEAIFLDVDGTLLDDHHQIPKENKIAIEKVRQKKIPVFIATGRAPQDLEAYYKELNLTSLAICMNGAYIVDFTKNEVIKEEEIPLFLLPKLKEKIDELNKEYASEFTQLSIAYYRGKKWFANKTSQSLDIEADNLGHGIELISFEEMMENWEAKKINPNKIGILCNEEDLLMKAYGPLKETFKESLNILKSQKNYLEITPLNVSKGNAIEFLIKNYYPHLKKENIMAIGDSDNDISMLSEVGFGIAMGNAASHIKELAFDTTSTNREAGLARALEKYILNKT